MSGVGILLMLIGQLSSNVEASTSLILQVIDSVRESFDTQSKSAPGYELVNIKPGRVFRSLMTQMLTHYWVKSERMNMRCRHIIGRLEDRRN